jgi:hypothetical protein
LIIIRGELLAKKTEVRVQNQIEGAIEIGFDNQELDLNYDMHISRSLEKFKHHLDDLGEYFSRLFIFLGGINYL